MVYQKKINPEKIQIVESIKKKFEGCNNLILVDYRGLSVKSITALRKVLREKDAVMEIMKNRLIKRAIEGTDIEGLSEYLTGPTAVILEKEDAVGPAKAVYDFMKDEPALEVKAGLLERQILGCDDIENLSRLPSKNELLTRLVIVLNSPISSLVRVLQGNITKFINVLNAIKEKKD